MFAKSLSFAAVTVFSAGLCFAGCDDADESPQGPRLEQVGQALEISIPGFVESVVLSGLQSPTVVRFASDGRVFVAEKRGRILVFSSLTDSTPEVFADLGANVHDFADRGLLGMALDPAFPSQPYVYVLYTYDAPIGGSPPTWGDGCPNPPGANADGCIVSGRLSRLTAAGGGNSWTGTEQVLINAWAQQYPTHSIGDLEFDGAGNLLVSGGEGASYDWADYGQDGNPINPLGDPPVAIGEAQTPPTAMGGALRSQSMLRPNGPVLLSGTVIRVDPATGNGVPGNPFWSSSDANAKRIVATGLRNPFRMRRRPGTSELFVGDVGWGSWEEINRIPDVSTSGSNFGWPCYEGADYQDVYFATNLNLCNTLYATPSAHTPPIFFYRHGQKAFPSDACKQGAGDSVTGLAFYEGGSYPDEFDGALFFADYARGCISVMKAGPDGQPDPATVQNLHASAKSPVFLEIGPGGDLFYCDIEGGTVRRIQYMQPVAVASAEPTVGQAPLEVEFDGTASVKPLPEDTLSYAWDLDGDGAFDDASGPTPTHVYQTAGTYQVTLEVTDQRGASSVSPELPIKVTSGPATNNSPVPVIDTPTVGTTWDVDDQITFSGHATDVEDGTLPAAALEWTVIIQHCSDDGCHAHHLQNFAGVASGDFAAVDHEYPMYLELELTATDSDGNVASVRRELHPQTFSVVLDSSPAGLTLAIGDDSGPAPFAKAVIAGSVNVVSAPMAQALGELTYAFESWSDGLAATHGLPPVTEPINLSAQYRVAGLTADYFGDVELEDLELTRIDPSVDFDFGSGSPHALLDADGFSARWSGKVVPEFSETYEFCVVSDEGARLWVNDLSGAPLVDDWSEHTASKSCGSIALEAGVEYLLRLEYWEGSGPAAIRLLWSSPSQPEQVIPPWRLYPGCSATEACPSELECVKGACQAACDPSECEVGEHCDGPACVSVCLSLECPPGDVCEGGMCLAGSSGAGGATSEGGDAGEASGGEPADAPPGGAPGHAGGASGGVTDGSGRPTTKRTGDDGCGCRTAGKPQEGAAWLWALGLALAYAARRRSIG